jgi:hypothetical protein
MESALKLLLPTAIAISLFACSRPPLQVRQEGPSVVIDLQSLGEYPSDVAGVRLIETSRKEVIWEVRGRDRAQVGRIRLTVGENPTLPVDVRHGTYEVIAPAGKQTFTLAPGTRYLVEVWASETKPEAKRTAEFATPG